MPPVDRSLIQYLLYAGRHLAVFCFLCCLSFCSVPFLWNWELNFMYFNFWNIKRTVAYYKFYNSQDTYIGLVIIERICGNLTPQKRSSAELYIGMNYWRKSRFFVGLCDLSPAVAHEDYYIVLVVWNTPASQGKPLYDYSILLWSSTNTLNSMGPENLLGSEPNYEFTMPRLAEGLKEVRYDNWQMPLTVNAPFAGL